MELYELESTDGQNPLLIDNRDTNGKGVAYLTFIVVGIGLLWPWNCLLSASEYFKNTLFGNDTVWARFFTSSMMTVSTSCSLLFNFWLAQRQYEYEKRVVNGLYAQIFVFLGLSLSCMCHSRLPLPFLFGLIILLTTLSYLASSLTQNGILAVANLQGSASSQAIVVGQAVAGVVPSLLLFAITMADKSAQDGVSILLYFSTTILICATCIAMYHKQDKPRILVGPVTEVPLQILFQKLKYLLLAIFTAFTITMVFPIFAANTRPNALPLTQAQYTPLVFLVWNMGDLLGRTWAPHIATPRRIYMYALARILALPLFSVLFWGTQNSNTPTLATDLAYMLLQLAFGFTNGHIVSLCFASVPRQLDSPEQKESASGITNVFVSTGLAAGSVVSYAAVLVLRLLARGPAA